MNLQELKLKKAIVIQDIEDGRETLCNTMKLGKLTFEIHKIEKEHIRSQENIIT